MGGYNTPDTMVEIEERKSRSWNNRTHVSAPTYHRWTVQSVMQACSWCHLWL